MARTNHFSAGVSLGAFSKLDALERRIQKAAKDGRTREVNQLIRQIERQARRLDMPQEVATQSSPSLFDRTLGVISAPVSGIAEGIRRQLKEGDLLSFVEGVGSGVASAATQGTRGITSFSDVLEEHGVKGLGATLGGLGLDIALDPTTYLTLGTSAEAKASTSVLTQASKAAAKGAKSATAKKAAEKAAIAATKKALKRGTRKGQKAAQEAVDDVALQFGRKAQAEALKQQPEAQLRFLGKRVAGSQKIYKGLSQVGERIKNTETGRTLNKAFRTRAKIPQEIQAIRRAFETQGAANFEEFAKDTRRIFRALDADELRQVSHAIESGESLVGQSIKNADAGLKSPLASSDLGDFQELATNLFDDLYDLEAFELGLKNVAKEGFEKQPNYVYHYYKKKGSKFDDFKKRKRKFKAISTEQPGFTKTRKAAPTLNEAIEEGLDPLERIDDILVMRFEKSFRVRARAKFVEAVADQYGVDLATKTGKTIAKEFDMVKASSDFLPNNIHVPRKVDDALKAVETAYDSVEGAREISRLYDRALGFWKFSVTAPNPGHHLRNLSGDVWLNWLDGVVNPNRYFKAGRILAARQGKRGGLPAAMAGSAGAGKGVRSPEILSILGKESEDALRLGAESLKDIKLKVGKTQLNGEQIWRLFSQKGGKSGFFRAELADLNTTRNKIISGLRDISEQREDYARLAHFIDAMKKEGKNLKRGKTFLRDLDKAADAAAARVRKFNIDYGDLTEFERRIVKKAVPFYTWLRKNIPLQLEMIAMRPGRFAAVPKGTRTIQQLLGTDEFDPEIGEIVPQWVMEMSPVRLRGEGETSNAIYWTPSLPAQDLTRFLEGFTPEPGKSFTEGLSENLRQVMGAATPAAVAPAELAFGETTIGSPIENIGQFGEGRLLPPIGKALLNTIRLATASEEDLNETEQRSERERIGESLINFMTGGGFRQITPQRQLGELRRRQDRLQKLQRRQE